MYSRSHDTDYVVLCKTRTNLSSKNIKFNEGKL